MASRKAKPRRGGIEPLADSPFESDETVRIKGLDHLFLETMEKRERIIVHPSEKRNGGLVPLDVGCAAGLNPSTNDVASELYIIAARIIHFIGLGGTAGKERLVKPASAPR